MCMLCVYNMYKHIFVSPNADTKRRREVQTTFRQLVKTRLYICLLPYIRITFANNIFCLPSENKTNKQTKTLIDLYSCRMRK